MTMIFAPPTLFQWKKISIFPNLRSWGTKAFRTGPVLQLVDFGKLGLWEISQMIHLDLKGLFVHQISNVVLKYELFTIKYSSFLYFRIYIERQRNVKYFFTILMIIKPFFESLCSLGTGTVNFSELIFPLFELFKKRVLYDASRGGSGQKSKKLHFRIFPSKFKNTVENLESNYFCWKTEGPFSAILMIGKCSETESVSLVVFLSFLEKSQRLQFLNFLDKCPFIEHPLPYKNVIKNHNFKR